MPTDETPQQRIERLAEDALEDHGKVYALRDEALRLAAIDKARLLLIEETRKYIEAGEQENARLKAEVERLRKWMHVSRCLCWDGDTQPLDLITRPAVDPRCAVQRREE